MQGTATQWLPVICQGTGGIGVDGIMPLVSYAVTRQGERASDQPLTSQLTVPLPKYNGLHSSLKAQCARWNVTWVWRLLGAFVLLAGTAGPIRAQRVTGPWEDGSIAPRGILRIGITPRWEQWSDVFDAGGDRKALGTLTSTDRLGAGFPFLPALATNLAVLTGTTTPRPFSGSG